MGVGDPVITGLLQRSTDQEDIKWDVGRYESIDRSDDMRQDRFQDGQLDIVECLRYLLPYKIF
jgi:hypothetical protein